jgi:bacillithiol synthase
VIPPIRLPGISALARDYLLHKPEALNFFAADYSRQEAWPERAEIVASAERADRREVIALLRQQNRKLGAGAKTMEHLAALEAPDALAIVTGQQAGLFGGPLYTLYKALTTCRLAEHWSERLGRPVVPVFYVVSEDHDFAEVQSAGYLDSGHQLRHLRYDPPQFAERIPVGQVRLADNIETLLAELAGSVPDGEFKPDLLTQLAGSYQSGQYFAEAFSRWYAQLLSHWGMVFLDPADPGLKRLAAPLFAGELERHITVEAMTRVNEQLTAGGYHVQLPVHPQRPNLFLLRNGRHSLERDGRGRWRCLHDGELFSLEELLTAPEQLSPKAALRPIVEDYWLPTLAYVGGPGEIAYWAQLQESYRRFGLPMPLVVPRAGFTLVEKRSQRLLDKFGIEINDFITTPEQTLALFREKMVPADLAAEFSHLRGELERRWPDLQGRVTALDPTLSAPAEKSLQQMIHTISQLENKVARAAELKEATVQSQLTALGNALLPGGVLQERQLNAVPFLFRHGRPLLETLYQGIDAKDPSHNVLVL